MPNNGYFDICHDTQIISAGGFFCQACSVGKPAAEQSLDPRYCWDCFGFLSGEAKLSPSGKRPAWIPKPQKLEKTGEKQYQVSQYGEGIMSTIIHPLEATGAIARGKRGPKHRELPEDLITQWGNRGMGSKAIAAKLKGEFSITVSCRTIRRILSGQRILVNV